MYPDSNVGKSLWEIPKKKPLSTWVFMVIIPKNPKNFMGIVVGVVSKGTYLEDHPSVSNFCLLVGFFGEKAQIFYTLGRSRYRVSWRIIPVSKWLVTQIGALKHDFLFSTG